jgi:hypothetical protein
VFGFFLATQSPIRHESVARERVRRFSSVVDWTSKTSWKPELNIRASSFHPPSIFRVKPTKINHPKYIVEEDERVVSADGRWLYCETVLPGGTPLPTFSGRRRGSVMFDGDVLIPALFHKNIHESEHWPADPFMSLTPMEILSLKAGTRLANGHVVLGGLGLGHQLSEVSKRHVVRKITVVEKSQALIDFVWPNVRMYSPRQDVEFVVGDAREIIPKMTVDVALIDIFPNYGFNTFPRCPNIGRVWCWGGKPGT